MQTVTGTLRVAGAADVLANYSFDILERVHQSRPGSLLFSTSTDENGEFSFQIRTGAYFLRAGSDMVPFRVKATGGSSTIGQLAE